MRFNFESEKNTTDRVKKLSEENPTKYLIVDVVFGVVDVTIKSYLLPDAPSHVHPKFKGYWKNGAFKKFSEKQIIKDQNIGIIGN